MLPFMICGTGCRSITTVCFSNGIQGGILTVLNKVTQYYAGDSGKWELTREWFTFVPIASFF